MVYEPETYWSAVGRRIERRPDESWLAGDDDPFLAYVREKVLRKFIATLETKGKTVLEVGCGPGGNLLFLARTGEPAKLYGVDIAQSMVELASRRLAPLGRLVEIHKADGASLPLPDHSVDLTLTVTVLQHNTNGARLKGLVREMCRVSRDSVACIEDTGTGGLDAEGSFVMRKLEVYRDLFLDQGFELAYHDFLNTRFSRLWRGFVRQVFYSRNHEEGAPIGSIPRTLVGAGLSITRYLDDWFSERKRWTKMIYRRTSTP